MKIYTAFICMMITYNILYSQDLKSGLRLELLNLKDTIKDGPNSYLTIRLVNESDSPITICENSSIEIYVKAIPHHLYKTRQGRYLDTITGECFSRTKYDGMPVVCTETILRQGEYKQFEFTLGRWGWYGLGLGRIRLKFFYVKRLNNNKKDAESDWVYLYFP
jgi:hypothetical protein